MCVFVCVLADQNCADILLNEKCNAENDRRETETDREASA